VSANAESAIPLPPGACARAGAALLLAGGLLAPRVSQACAVCIGGQSDVTQRAFLVGTLILSTLPLILIGGIVFFVRRHLRAAPPAVSPSASSRS
jgi:hypothetical protein